MEVEQISAATSEPDVDSSSSNIENLQNLPYGTRRFVYLSKAMDKTMGRLLSLLRFSVLKKHLLLSKNAEDRQILFQLHQQFIESLDSNMKEEVKLMYKEENIEKLLNEFDLLCSSRVRSQESWRPSGVPEQDIAAHLKPGLSTLQSKLQQLHRETEAESDRLCRSVTERHKLLDSLESESRELKCQLMQVVDKMDIRTNNML